MEIWIGIDGGGTKTQFAAIGEDGRQYGVYRTGGVYYHQIGVDEVCRRLTRGIDALCLQGEYAGIQGICFGMPGYGESGEADSRAVEAVRAALPPVPLHVVNDVEVGWAGALAIAPGINIVAGTGSIAYGRDGAGRSMRCGGWASFFSDEGSCYWLGRRTLELFAKQSDGRCPVGPLYGLLKERLGIREDWEVNVQAREIFAPSREQTAALQEILFLAAEAGDPGALALYEEAGKELAQMVRAVAEGLSLREPAVSYSGGLFATGERILEPLCRELRIPIKLCPPALSPAQGAALLAVERFRPQALGQMRKNMLEASA